MPEYVRFPILSSSASKSEAAQYVYALQNALRSTPSIHGQMGFFWDRIYNLDTGGGHRTYGSINTYNEIASQWNRGADALEREETEKVRRQEEARRRESEARAQAAMRAEMDRQRRLLEEGQRRILEEFSQRKIREEEARGPREAVVRTPAILQETARRDIETKKVEETKAQVSNGIKDKVINIYANMRNRMVRDRMGEYASVGRLMTSRDYYAGMLTGERR